MAFTYSSLVADKNTADSIKSWAVNDSIPSTTILLMAEQFIYHDAKLRIRQMLGTETGTMTIGEDYITLSNLTGTFLGPIITMHYTGVDKDDDGIRQRTIEDIENSFSYDASGTRVNHKPKHLFVDDTRINFDAPPDKAYGWRSRLFLEPAALSDSNETNFLTDSFPRLLLAACLWATADFRKDDEERLHWERIVRTAVGEAMAEYDRVRLHGIDATPHVE